MNHSMIFMGMFEEAFSTLAEKMTEAMAMGTAAIADALAEACRRAPRTREPQSSKKIQDEITPEVRTQIGHVFSGIREEMASQWPKNASVFKQYISSPAFDKGIEIVEKYDFGRPRLTEKLSDEVLASYVFLVQSGDQSSARCSRSSPNGRAASRSPRGPDTEAESFAISFLHRKQILDYKRTETR